MTPFLVCLNNAVCVDKPYDLRAKQSAKVYCLLQYS